MTDNNSNWPWKYDFVPNLDAREFFAKGVGELDSGDWLSALASFERAVQLEKRPVHCSFLALCIAKERGQHQQAIAICQQAIAIEPANPDHFLNLGKIHLIRGEKVEGIRIFREGLKAGRSPRIIEELEKLGIRRPPVIPFLSRDSSINKYLGIILSRLGIS
jgi:tetratricopeptide (TPR) repeat protein